MKKRVKPSLKLPTEPEVYATSLHDYILMIYGPPGVGKTTLVNSLAERVLFISTDRGTRFLKAMRVECNSWNQIDKTIKALEKKPPPYDIVCIDHIDDLCNIIEEEILVRLQIESLADLEWGKGWKAFRQTLSGLINRLLKLKVGIVFIAHETIKTIRTRTMELERTMPAMSKTSWRVITPLVDFIGYCTIRSFKKGKGKREERRIIVTEPTEELYAKDRTNRQKPQKGWEEMDAAALIQTFGKGQHGKAKAKGKRRRTRS